MENTYFNLKYLHKYPNNDEFSGFCYTDRYYEPFVSTTFLEEGVKDRVDYNLRRRQKMLKEYLTFEFLEDGSFVWKSSDSTAAKTISYRINKSEWTEITSTTDGISVPVSKDDIVEFKGNNETYCNEINRNASSGETFSAKMSYFSVTTQFNAYGNTMSLIDSDNFVLKDNLTEDMTFLGLFNGCTGLLDAEYVMLPAMTLTESCYERMFNDCSNMLIAPELPAMTLTDRCYYAMFLDCGSLVKCPELPATVLGLECYYEMFRQCYKITEAPKLPATILPDACYKYMFNRCYAITKTSVVYDASKTTLGKECFRGMYAFCTGLTEASIDLQLETIPEGTLYSTFYSATTLSNVKAVIGAENSVAEKEACRSLFQDTSISDASNIHLNPITVGDSGYCFMFYQCYNLTEVPELPATTIGNACYLEMFGRCSNLEKSAKLIAKEMKPQCYKWMYTSTKVNEIVCLAENLDYMSKTVSGVTLNDLCSPDECVLGIISKNDASSSVQCNFYVATGTSSKWSGCYYQSYVDGEGYKAERVKVVPNGWTIVEYQE